MEFLQKIKGGIYNGIGFVLVLGITGIAYGAYTSMTDVTTGQSLTASLFNQIQENIRVLRTDVDKSSPAGAVMAFNLANCPTGWIIANGANGTPDLRGEFIRGLDSGRGIDSGRTLASWQKASYIVYDQQNLGRLTSLYSNLSENTQAWADQLGVDLLVGHTESINTNVSRVLGAGTNAFSDNPNAVGGSRPRNVALLYCVKQ